MRLFLCSRRFRHRPDRGFDDQRVARCEASVASLLRLGWHDHYGVWRNSWILSRINRWPRLGRRHQATKRDAPPPSALSPGFRVAPLGAIAGVSLGTLAWSSLGHPGFCEFGEGLVREVVIALAIFGGVISFLLARLWAMHEQARFDSRAANMRGVERD